jgi:uncharacterized protein (TIGR03435 family)
MAVSAPAQSSWTAPLLPKFEVASVKAADSGQAGQSGSAVHYEFQNMTMKALAEFLGRAPGRGPLDLPVVDATELTGIYQVSMDIQINEIHGGAAGPATDQGSQAVPVASDPLGNSLRMSLEKQGIRLVRRSAPVDKIVIEHIERTPKEN